jgi:hypothetical protein
MACPTGHLAGADGGRAGAEGALERREPDALHALRQALVDLAAIAELVADELPRPDPTLEASIRMLFDPPDCAGCGEPLWGKRPDAKQHGPACIQRRRRREARAKVST